MILCSARKCIIPQAELELKKKLNVKTELNNTESKVSEPEPEEVYFQEFD